MGVNGRRGSQHFRVACNFTKNTDTQTHPECGKGFLRGTLIPNYSPRFCCSTLPYPILTEMDNFTAASLYLFRNLFRVPCHSVMMLSLLVFHASALITTSSDLFKTFGPFQQRKVHVGECFHITGVIYDFQPTLTRSRLEIKTNQVTI